MSESGFIILIFFFFQAEDGIRDDLVTGVQTCALPIFLIWILYKIVFSQEYRSTVTTNVKTYLQEPSHGFVQQYPVTTGQVVYQTQPTVYNPNLIVPPQNIVYG